MCQDHLYLIELKNKGGEKSSRMSPVYYTFIKEHGNIYVRTFDSKTNQ